MAVAVEGMSSLLRAFAAADKALERDLKDALEEAAAPVSRDARSLSAGRIRNLEAGDPWSVFRIGSTRSVVYVAPRERGTTARGDQRKRRRNLGNLLMDRAMQPALERNRGAVERRVEQMLGEVANVWERTP